MRNHLRVHWHKYVFGLGWLVLGSFKVVMDELLTLARYCGRDCLYPYPLIGTFSQYDAESIADAMIILGALMITVGAGGDRHAARAWRKFRPDKSRKTDSRLGPKPRTAETSSE